MWLQLKTFFKDSETIFLARIEAATGFVIAALALIDWGPLLDGSSLSWRQWSSIGGVMLAKGVITEWARRRRAPEI